jgi:hypothetical protein
MASPAIWTTSYSGLLNGTRRRMACRRARLASFGAEASISRVTGPLSVRSLRFSRVALYRSRTELGESIDWVIEADGITTGSPAARTVIGRSKISDTSDEVNANRKARNGGVRSSIGSIGRESPRIKFASDRTRLDFARNCAPSLRQRSSRSRPASSSSVKPSRSTTKPLPSMVDNAVSQHCSSSAAAAPVSAPTSLNRNPDGRS